MRRFIIVFLAIHMLLLTGCKVPFFGKSENDPPAVTGESELVGVYDNDREGEQPGVPESEDDSIETEDAAGLSETETTQTTETTGTTGATETTGTTGEEAADSVLYVTDPTGSGDKTGVLAAQSDSDSSVFFSEPRRSVTVYYQDADGYLVPMTRWIEPQPGIARASLNLVIDSALNREELIYYGVYPVIPENTEIQGIDIKEGIATVDFNRHLLNYDSALSERNIVASIVYTMTEFETIERVKILINGYPQGILKYGTDLEQPLGRDDVMINGDLALTPAGTFKVDVFLMKQANIGFIYPVPLSVADTTDADYLPEILVKQLLDTKTEGLLVSEIPQDVALLDTSIVNGTITLNFSEEFINYGGTAREEGILKQLAYTLRQCNGIRRLRITVEGREVGLPEGTDISQGLAIPVTINDVIDR
jgi:germination protein M